MAFVECGLTAPLNSDCHYIRKWPDVERHIETRTPVQFRTTIGPFDLNWPTYQILAGGGPSLPLVWPQDATRLLPRTCQR